VGVVVPIISTAFYAGLIREEQTEITGLFTDNGIVAIGVMEARRQVGLGVPCDLSVIGYDDSSFASLTPFSLTSVRVHRKLMGELAGRLVKEVIHAGRPVDARDAVLPVELIKRGVVGAPRRNPYLRNPYLQTSPRRRSAR